MEEGPLIEAGPDLTWEAEIRDTSGRPVRSDEETLAGAPLCSRMLTFLSRSTREIALGDVLPGRACGGHLRVTPEVTHTNTHRPLSCSPACWMREAGVDATGSAALRSRLAGAPVGGPGGRARGPEPRSCPILSSRSCSRRSRSTSSGFRAAPWEKAQEAVSPRGVASGHPSPTSFPQVGAPQEDSHKAQGPDLAAGTMPGSSTGLPPPLC